MREFKDALLEFMRGRAGRISGHFAVGANHKALPYNYHGAGQRYCLCPVAALIEGEQVTGGSGHDFPHGPYGWDEPADLARRLRAKGIRATAKEVQRFAARYDRLGRRSQGLNPRGNGVATVPPDEALELALKALGEGRV